MSPLHAAPLEYHQCNRVQYEVTKLSLPCVAIRSVAPTITHSHIFQLTVSLASTMRIYCDTLILLTLITGRVYGNVNRELRLGKWIRLEQVLNWLLTARAFSSF
jgi:hypothetical protein